MPSRVVLVVEDDPVIGDQLQIALAATGYDVLLARYGSAALSLLDARAPALVLLDLGLPDLDGLELCRLLRARLPESVIIVLTARHDEIDVVAGLESGADDYLFKPFKLVELLARLRAHLRRAAPATRDPAEVLQVLDLRIDLLARRADLGTCELVLRGREFDLLARLAAAPGVAVRREQLLDDVWDRNWDGSSKTLDVHVLALRRKLRAASPSVRVPRIETLRGFGYRLEGEPAPRRPY